MISPQCSVHEERRRNLVLGKRKAIHHRPTTKAAISEPDRSPILEMDRVDLETFNDDLAAEFCVNMNNIGVIRAKYNRSKSRSKPE